MKLTYGELVEELQERSAKELVDLVEVAKHYAIERRREEIKSNIEASWKELAEGKLPEPTDDMDELWRRFEESQGGYFSPPHLIGRFENCCANNPNSN